MYDMQMIIKSISTQVGSKPFPDIELSIIFLSHGDKTIDRIARPNLPRTRTRQGFYLFIFLHQISFMTSQ